MKKKDIRQKNTNKCSLQGIKKLASYSHRTATTTYPCYIPVLGDSVGAGRIRLARGAKVWYKVKRKKKMKTFKILYSDKTKYNKL